MNTDRDFYSEPIMDSNAAARFLGHENRYLVDVWRDRSKGPSYYKLGDGPKARIRYSLHDLVNFLLRDAK